MADRFKALWQKILDWWNKFTAKQKTLVVGAGTVVLLTLIILLSALKIHVGFQRAIHNLSTVAICDT